MTGPAANDADLGERAAYAAFHAHRFDVLFAVCRRIRPDRQARVLDVGRSLVSFRLVEMYDTVWTLGYPEGNPSDGGLAGHITFDLNDAFGGNGPQSDQRFDLIVFAETLEHLIAPPQRALEALARLLAPGGAMICQTPNAASLANRLKLLAGRNPFERLRDWKGNFGHIRESTGSELKTFARDAGLAVESHSYHEYFGWPQGAARRAVEAAIRSLSALAPSIRRGQMAVLRKA